MSRFLLRTLQKVDYDLYAEHLLQFDAGDRRRRFWALLSDATIRKHVEKLRANPTAAVIAHMDAELRVVGAIEVVPVATGDGRRCVEVGLSVLPAWRGRSLGDALLGRAARWARAHGANQAIASCLADNHPMVRLAKRHGIAGRVARGGV